MKLVIDENIPYAAHFFADIADLEFVHGRQVSGQQIQDADALLVRSITPVNAALLEGSAIQFVGSATIGTDHCDLNYLSEQGIGFSNAPGCNARSVAEYVIAALLAIEEQSEGWHLWDKRVAIIGAGNVGTALASMLDCLGVEYVLNDPILQRHDTSRQFVSLAEALSCDVISLHVPLTREGDYPTHYLLNADNLASLKSDVVLINSSRGPVIENKALDDFLSHNPKAHAVLDVWEAEPVVDFGLLDRVTLSSAHIAGYSFDGKVKGTQMIYQALCQHFCLPIRQSLTGLPDTVVHAVEFNAGHSLSDKLRMAIRQVYDIYMDDHLFRQLKRQQNPSSYFDKLRKQYRMRREWNAVSISARHLSTQEIGLFKSLGFTLIE